MNKLDLKKFLREKEGYQKWGAFRLSRKLNVSYQLAKEVLAEVKNEKRTKAPVEGFKRMFFDIETSPNVVYSWRIGYNLNIPHDNIVKERAIICICYKWEGEEEVHHLTWDQNQDDSIMLGVFIEEMMKADEVVGHNGDRFDIPWVKTRAAIHGLNFPAYVKSLDTLTKAKKEKFNFNSNKLDYLAEILLGERKMETGGFSLWLDIIERKDQKALQKMVEYCKKDVVLLEKVFHKLQNYIKPNTHVGSIIGKGKESCSNCGEIDFSDVKMLVTAAGTQQHLVQCNCCNAYNRISATTYKSLKDNGKL